MARHDPVEVPGQYPPEIDTGCGPVSDEEPAPGPAVHEASLAPDQPEHQRRQHAPGLVHVEDQVRHQQAARGPVQRDHLVDPGYARNDELIQAPGPPGLRMLSENAVEADSRKLLAQPRCAPHPGLGVALRGPLQVEMVELVGREQVCDRTEFGQFARQRIVDRNRRVQQQFAPDLHHRHAQREHRARRDAGLRICAPESVSEFCQAGHRSSVSRLCARRL